MLPQCHQNPKDGVTLKSEERRGVVVASATCLLYTFSPFWTPSTLDFGGDRLQEFLCKLGAFVCNERVLSWCIPSTKTYLGVIQLFTGSSLLAMRERESERDSPGRTGVVVIGCSVRQAVVPRLAIDALFLPLSIVVGAGGARSRGCRAVGAECPDGAQVPTLLYLFLSTERDNNNNNMGGGGSSTKPTVLLIHNFFSKEFQWDNTSVLKHSSYNTADL